MAFLNKVKENVNLKEGVSRITAKVSDIAQSGKEKGQELLRRNKTDEENVSEEEMEEMGSKMLEVLDWAFDKANGTLHPAEKLYLQSLGHELGYAEDALKMLFE